MKGKLLKLDSVSRIIVLFILLSVGFSFSYYFFIKPFVADRSLKKCLKDAQYEYSQEKYKIESEINSINELKSSKEDKKQELENDQRQLSDYIENKLKSIEMVGDFKNRKILKFNENKCNETDSDRNRLSFTANCADSFLEKAVIRDYKNENEDYVKVSNNLEDIRNEIKEMDKKIETTESDDLLKEAGKSLKEKENFCFKLY